MFRGRWAVIGLLGAMSGGCGAGDPEVRFAVRDSLGVQIVEFDADRIEHSWYVAPEPELVVGAESDDPTGLALHAVVDAIEVGGRTLFIAEGSTQQVISVDLSTWTVSRWGGAGDGPDEFRGVSRLFDLSDGSVGVYDRARLRVLQNDDEGSTREILRAEATGGSGEAPLVEILGRGPEERTVFLAYMSGLPPEPTEGSYRGTGPLVRFARGEAADTLGSVRGLTTFWHPDVGAGAVLFGATTVVAGGNEGLWVGDTDEPELVLWGTTGGVVRIVRWSSTSSRELTSERTRAFWNELEASVPVPERPGIAMLREALPVAERVPVFGSVHAGPGGELWIGEPISPAVTLLERAPEPQHWRVVDFSSGRVVEVTTPHGVKVLRVGDEHILGLHRDELGTETIRRYRLRKEG